MHGTLTDSGNEYGLVNYAFSFPSVKLGNEVFNIIVTSLDGNTPYRRDIDYKEEAGMVSHINSGDITENETVQISYSVEGRVVEGACHTFASILNLGHTGVSNLKIKSSNGHTQSK